ncbi:MAG TPA: response regulator [Rhodanobacteraceae bacterium]|nr:response regulator [Rhodanobacteraceae bacterium]
MDHPSTPRILLAEDDPVSRVFLAEALHGLGLEVEAVADGEAAVIAARKQQFDALLLDHDLPGMNGDAVLHAVRADPDAASRGAVAIATTAEPDPTIHAGLRARGFARVLVKPLAGMALRKAFSELGIACARATGDPEPALDDSAGRRASGSMQALAALRGLFAQELAVLASEWNLLPDDALAQRLHRLRAACGFCGASALQVAAERLSEAMRDAEPAKIEACRGDFRHALTTTREALEHTCG